jgi:branched-chain amino acid transport system permease protein
MSFGVARLVNFAHGSFMAFGGLVTASFALSFHASLGMFVLAAIVGAGATGVLALLAERLLFPGRTGDEGAALLVSIALVVILENGMTQFWGGQGRAIPPVVGGSISFAGAQISNVSLIEICVALVLIALYFVVVRFTRLGAQWRAVSQDAHAAELLGIRVGLHRSLAFAIGTALAGIAGALLLLETSVTPLTGEDYIPIAFAAVIVGGLGHPLGALIGGLLIGLAQSFAGAYGSTQYINAVAMVVLVLVLIVRPSGLFGSKAIEH